MSKYLIIGNGIAGITAAETIRSLDSQGGITMIAAEEHLPYSRPLISMVLEGSLAADRLAIRDQGWYQRLGIEPLIGHKVVELDPAAGQVLTDRGTRVPYERLLIASGADPRPAKAANHDLPGVFCMRDQSQVQGMLALLPQVESALVLGGGLVGFKAAYGLLHQGKKVTMLIRSSHPLTMQVDDQAGALIRRELEENGLEVRVGVEAVAFEGAGRVQRAQLSDGASLDCQLVVVGKGVTPAAGFAPADSVQMDLGILVDQHQATTVAGIFAAGDVAQGRDLAHGQTRVNAIWPVAVEQGRVAGANMAGRPVRYPGSVGRNMLRIFGLDVMTGGMIQPPEGNGYQVLKRFDPRRKLYRKLVLEDGVLKGITLLGQVEQGGVLLALLQRGQPLAVDPSRLLDPGFNYATLLP